MSPSALAAKLSRRAWRTCRRLTFGNAERAIDGIAWLRARRLFQQSGLFAALPLTGRVLEVEGDRGYLVEAAVHHIPNRRCIVVDSGRNRRHRVDHRVRRRKFHRVCAPPDRLPFADATFDAAWSTFALGRLTPAVQERALAEMARVVRPGGALVAIERVPDTVGGKLRARLGEMLMLQEPWRARFYRSAAEWRAVLSRHGWQVEAERVFDDGTGPSSCRTYVCCRV